MEGTTYPISPVTGVVTVRLTVEVFHPLAAFMQERTDRDSIYPQACLGFSGIKNYLFNCLQNQCLIETSRLRRLSSRLKRRIITYSVQRFDQRHHSTEKSSTNI